VTILFVVRAFGSLTGSGGRYLQLEQRKLSFEDAERVARQLLAENARWEVRIDKYILREDAKLDSAILLGFWRRTVDGRVTRHAN